MSRFLLVSSLLCASCRNTSSDAQQAPTPPAPPPSEQPAAPASEPAAPAPPPPKSDPVDSQSLKTGLATMQPRLKAQVEAIGKIEPNAQGRFFMHPGEDKNASLEFDTKGLTSLELAPFIQDFGANADCRNNPDAGVVQLTWIIDNGKQNHVTVDRNYAGTIPVSLAKSTRLKVEVDKGNGTPLCDWFTVGFVNVK